MSFNMSFVSFIFSVLFCFELIVRIIGNGIILHGVIGPLYSDSKISRHL